MSSKELRIQRDIKSSTAAAEEGVDAESDIFLSKAAHIKERRRFGRV
jgi:hypothetical protein